MISETKDRETIKGEAPHRRGEATRELRGGGKERIPLNRSEEGEPSPSNGLIFGEKGDNRRKKGVNKS